MNKVLRFIVYIQGQEIPAQYNTDLGKNALIYAKITASKYKGVIFAQNSDDTFTEIKSCKRG